MVDSTMFSKYYIFFSIFIYIYYIKGDKIEIQIISKMYGTIDGSFRPSPVIINKTILAHTEVCVVCLYCFSTTTTMTMTMTTKTKPNNDLSQVTPKRSTRPKNKN